MTYTAYTEEQYNKLPKKYRKEVLGISYDGNIIQIPLCPECGGHMMENEGYLLCTECGNISRKRIIKDEESSNV